jgi:hypothetical protein
LLLPLRDSRYIEYLQKVYKPEPSRLLRAAARAVLYDIALWPPAYGLVRKLPGLRLGEVVMEVPEKVRRLDSRLAGPAARAAAHNVRRAGRRRHGCETALRIARASGVKSFAGADYAAGRGALLRLPLLADSEQASIDLFQSAQHLGVSRMYQRTMPEFAGTSQSEARQRWPVAFEVSRQLVTLPTHGRLAASDVDALERLVRSSTATQAHASTSR